MIFRRKKIVSRWFDFINDIFFLFQTVDRYYQSKIKKILTDRSMLSVASMTDSIDR
jgi:hypothetical protein